LCFVLDDAIASIQVYLKKQAIEGHFGISHEELHRAKLILFHNVSRHLRKHRADVFHGSIPEVCWKLPLYRCM